MGGKLHWLEAMRAIAAIWVVFAHANHSVTAFVGPLPFSPQLFANGGLGVDFFFVLSGFIIAFSTYRLIESGRGWRDYVSARAIRIYIPYLPIGLAMLAFYLLFPSVGQGVREPGAVSSLTLLPMPSPPALSVAWSLVHELIFYAVFSLLFVSRPLLVGVLLAWTLFIAGWAYFDGGAVPGWWYLANPVNLCFFLGVGLFHVTRKGVTGPVAAACALVGVLALATQAGAELPNRWITAAGFASLIVVALSGAAQRLSPGRWFLFLGAASYSIYLVHNPALSVVARILRRWFPSMPPGIAIFAMVALAVLIALVYYVAYERPTLAWARAQVSRYLKQRTPVAATIVAGESA